MFGLIKKMIIVLKIMVYIKNLSNTVNGSNHI